MTDGRPDHGFSLTPRPIAAGASSRERRRRISALVVLFVAGGLVAVASFGPRLGERPSFNPAFFATPRTTAAATDSIPPSPTPTPNGGQVTTTPLPPVTGNDLGLVTGSVGILADGFRVLDVRTGSVVNQVPSSAGQDAIVASPSGSGWICVCLVDQVIDAGIASRGVDLVSIAPDGSETSRDHVGSFAATGGVPAVSIQTDVDVALDGRSGVIATVIQTASTFTTFVAPVNLATGSFGPVVKLASRGPLTRPSSAATPTPPQPGDPARYPTSDTYTFGPFVRVSPDGGHAFVWETIELQGQEGPIASSRSAWRVDVSRSDPKVDSARGLTQLPDYCLELVFLDDHRLDAFCRDAPAVNNDATAPARWSLLELDPNGEIQHRSEVLGACSYDSEVLFDVANEAVWMWTSSQLTLCRVDLATLLTARVTFDPSADAAAGITTLRGSPPVWRRPMSTTLGTNASSMAGSPLGDRLYLIGSDQTPREFASQPTSLGIFVVDPATLALVGRWAADAMYVGVQTLRDGSIVAAVGAPQVDETGQEAPWDASVTFHDAADGRILLRLGQIGQGYGAALYDP